MNTLPPFHLAVPVSDLGKPRIFYRETLGFEEGRSSDYWVDFNFFGHQLVIHLSEEKAASTKSTNSVDGKQVPIPHFRVVLTWEHFQAFAEHLRNKKIKFAIEPYIRFKGKKGSKPHYFFTILREMPLNSKRLK